MIRRSTFGIDRCGSGLERLAFARFMSANRLVRSGVLALLCPLAFPPLLPRVAMYLSLVILKGAAVMADPE
jgi:hypothetical protein